MQNDKTPTDANVEDTETVTEQTGTTELSEDELENIVGGEIYPGHWWP